jgi:SAM-dependent methyltransferase
LFPPTAGTLTARFDRWPLADGSQDVVFGMLAIHELRSDTGRAAWFSEAKRCLADDGKIILVEHVRDLANFVAFGPGFLHFHAVASWRKSWEAGGFTTDDDFRITPFVRVFVLKKS